MRCINACLCVLQENGKYTLNNHLRFQILFHRDEETDLARIVGFEVDCQCILSLENPQCSHGI
jgi:hypothetical protein